MIRIKKGNGPGLSARVIAPCVLELSAAARYNMTAMMRLYYQDDKLVMDASGRVILKDILFLGVVIGTVIQLVSLAQDIKDNIFPIIFFGLVLLFCCASFVMSDPALIKVSFDRNGIAETRQMFIKGKQIAWAELEDYYFVEFSPTRSEYPKYYRAVFTSKIPHGKKAYSIRSPYFNSRQKDEYEHKIRDYCDRAAADSRIHAAEGDKNE